MPRTYGRANMAAQSEAAQSEAAQSEAAQSEAAQKQSAQKSTAIIIPRNYISPLPRELRKCSKSSALARI
jgi:hypothetical protein